MNNDLWVFGYGSLIWRPGFDYVERRPALLRGLHRALCLYSYVHRGTPKDPGIVAGLDRGGACRGMAFRVPGEGRNKVIDYLREREQMNYCYLEKYRSLQLAGQDPKAVVDGLCFVVNRTHEQYCGGLNIEQKARLVLAGKGASGFATEYLDNLVASLEALEIHDEGLIKLQSRVHALLSEDRADRPGNKEPAQTIPLA